MAWAPRVRVHLLRWSQEIFRTCGGHRVRLLCVGQDPDVCSRSGDYLAVTSPPSLTIDSAT